MKEKLQILMQNENLTPSGLARKLGVKPSVISHLLKGRNQPSYSLTQRIAISFPQINTSWILGVSEEMYNSSTPTQPAASEPADTHTPVQPELFQDSTENNDEESGDINDTLANSANDSDFGTGPQSPLFGRTAANGSAIERIIIVYSNGTFESLTPRK